jgi:hypothetical protein
MDKVMLSLCGFSDGVLSLALRRKIIEVLLKEKLTAKDLKKILDYAAYGAECNTQCMIIMDGVWQKLLKEEETV